MKAQEDYANNIFTGTQTSNIYKVAAAGIKDLVDDAWVGSVITVDNQQYRISMVTDLFMIVDVNTNAALLFVFFLARIGQKHWQMQEH